MTQSANRESVPSATQPVVRPDGWKPHIVAFVCNWCSYAGADMAGTTRIEYPATVRLVRFPCTGRMNPLAIVKAFDHGADGVLVSGCHPGDCHYVQGNLVARRRFTLFRSLMDFIGLDLRRLHFAWVSASEGHKWAKVVSEVSQAVHEAGPLPGWKGLPGEGTIELPELAAPVAGDDRVSAAEVLDQLRVTAANLLASNDVDLFIGYRDATQPDTLAPAMLTRPDQVDTLQWGQGAVHNLAVYLSSAAKERAGTVGMVAKRCDVAAVEGLVREGQVNREAIRLVGVPCSGVMEDGSPPAKCATCTGEVDPICDVIITGGSGRVAPPTSEVATEGDPRDEQVAFLESLPATDRWRFWQDQFRRCLRCYACRAACPLCYCPSCISEQHRPQWIPTTIDERANTAWNVIRATHLAGRCTGCDQCSRSCPAEIRLDLLNRKMALEVERQFGGGLDPGERAALTEFRMEDPEGFIL